MWLFLHSRQCLLNWHHTVLRIRFRPLLGHPSTGCYCSKKQCIIAKPPGRQGPRSKYRTCSIHPPGDPRGYLIIIDISIPHLRRWCQWWGGQHIKNFFPLSGLLFKKYYTVRVVLVLWLKNPSCLNHTYQVFLDLRPVTTFIFENLK